jgi:hypothetical protein
MKGILTVACLTSAMLSICWAPQTQANSIGAGVHYLRAVGNFDDDDEIDRDNFGVLGSLQFGASMFKLEANTEFVFDYLGTDETLIKPSAYVLIGSVLYGGAGIGIGYLNEDWESDPFYALRAGVDIPFGKLSGDIYATYRFQESEDLEDLPEDLDSATLSGVLRYHF